MTGFNERRQKQDAEFHIDTLTEWLNFKINTYLKQADKADKEKIRAIFKYFHFLEGAVPEVRNVKPLTPKEIGYLSPRVPRPVYLEKPPAGDAEPIEKTKTPKEIKNYEKAKQVMLEDGSGVLIQTREFTLENGIFDIKKGELVPLSVKIGKKIRIKNKDFSFAGVIEDEKSKYNGEPIGKLASGEELYRVFSAEDLDSGIFSYEAEELMISVDGIKDEVEIFCQTE